MTTTTTSTPLTAETIAKFEAAGFRRWTKGRFDRLYIDTKLLGLEVEYYNTGNVRNATWCGESISNSDGRRFLASKVFVDVQTGELSVKDCTNLNFAYYDMPSIEDRAREVVDAILAPEPEVEPETIDETTDETTDAQAQADADFIEFLKTGGKFDASAEDGHFTIEGREYVVSDADGETTIERVDGKPFQHSELDAYLGDFDRDRDFDTNAIIDEVTYVDANGTRRWLDLDLVEFAAIVESHELKESETKDAMARELRVVFTEGTPDMLGNDANIETSIAFIGAESFVTMTFGGRDGMQRDSITLDELREIFSRIGIDVK
ncbi:MAG: hypothetical protein IKG21_13105 [Atopobiaceae bacterium]|nr:hypothetical protein [Atopobiaceae bacterium]